MIPKIKSDKNLVNPFAVHSKTLTALFEKSDTPAFRIVAPKKNIKKAVDRNKVKRRIREIVYDYNKNKSINAKVIIVAKHDAQNSNFQTIQNDCVFLLDKYVKVRGKIV
jgi:ribonuclease P protein component